MAGQEIANEKLLINVLTRGGGGGVVKYQNYSKLEAFGTLSRLSKISRNVISFLHFSNVKTLLGPEVRKSRYFERFKISRKFTM